MPARRTTLLTSAAVAVLALSACGAPGSGGGTTQAPATAASGTAAACAPVAGDKLVLLTDDKGLQNADNVLPAVNTKAATDHPSLVTLLDSVSAKLDTPTLVSLNKSVDVDRRTSSDVAKEFVQKQGLAATDQSGGGAAVVVGAAGFSESATLAEIYAEVLRSAGYQASTRTIGSRETYLPALESGQLTAVPEYAASLATYLNSQANGANAAPVASSDVDKTVAALTPLAAKAGLTIGTASKAQDQNGFAVTQAFADKLSTLSDLASACGGVVLAGPAECPQRPFCQIGLEHTYGLKISDFKSYDFGAIGQAIRKGDATIGLVLTSDGSLG
jgi:osmoprotectant transport system substrate-binding protein